MWSVGKFLIWYYISQVYQQDQEYPIKLALKISDQHMYLHSYSVMCVKFATQIQSEYVGKVLEHFGNMEKSETAKYCKMFDSFFDCMTVKTLEEH